MSSIVREAKVCIDCYELAAFGKEALDSMDRATVVSCSRGLDHLSKSGYVTTGCEQYGFSYTPCECCCRRLGGDRYQVVVLA